MSNTEDQKTDQFKPIDNPDGENGMSDDTTFSKDPELNQWIIEGIEKLDAKDFKSAIRMFEKVLRVDPDNMSAFEKLSIARSIQADIDRISEYMAMGRELMNQREWSGAIEEFQAILSIDPDHEEAKTCLRQVQQHLGQVPDETGTGLDASDFEMTSGGEPVFDFDANVDDLGTGNEVTDQETGVLEEYPGPRVSEGVDDPEFQRRLEEALRIYENGNLKRAKELLEELQNEYPGQAQVDFYLTAIARRLEADQIRSDQSNAETLFKQGMDMLENQDFEGARELFQRVLQVRPEFEQAQLMLDRVGSMMSMSATPMPAGDTSEVKPMKAEGKPRELASKSSRPLPPPPVPRRSRNYRFLIISSVVVGVIIVAVIGFFSIHYPRMRFEKLTTQARTRFQEKAYVEAIALLESAIVIQPDSFDSLYMLGDAYTASGNFADAVKAYQNALVLQPDNKPLIMKIADAQYDAQLWGAAEATYQELTGDMRFQEEAYYKIGMTRKKRNQLEEAIQAFRKTLEVNDAHSKAHFELARCLEDKAANPDLDEEQAEALRAEAEQEYQQSINTDPKFVMGYEVLSDFYSKHEDYEQAAAIMKRLLAWFKPTTLEKSREVARLREKLGKAQYNSGDYDGAVESFTTVIQIEPNVEAFRDLGRAHYKAGKLTEAILVWRRGLELDSEDADLYFQIAVAQFRQGDLAASESSYKDALRIDPKLVKALTNLGFLYYQNYKYDLAQMYWQRSVELDPTQDEVKRRLKEIERK
nr:tetratricopeptide repeat protein [bacterium]